MKKYVRRHYVLVEVVIALTLVMLCVFPLIYLHSQILKKEAYIILESQCEQIADNTYAEIKQRFYQEEYAKTFPVVVKNLPPEILPNNTEVSRLVTIENEGLKENKYLLKMNVELASKLKYEYFFVVEDGSY